MLKGRERRSVSLKPPPLHAVLPDDLFGHKFGVSTVKTTVNPSNALFCYVTT
jgi:hypothetical protein